MEFAILIALYSHRRQWGLKTPLPFSILFPTMRIQKHPGSGLWVTDDGRVIMPPAKYSKFKKFRFTFGSKDSGGYMVVKFRGKIWKVHKLVIEAFVENKLGLPTTDHINRVRDDNRLENLRYCSYKTQRYNQQNVEDCLAKYGVRPCENKAEYKRAYYANNPEYAERQRTLRRKRYSNNPEYAELQRAKNREWKAKNAERGRTLVREWRIRQRALGRCPRKCPDGKTHWLTDEEYNARFGGNQQIPLF